MGPHEPHADPESSSIQAIDTAPISCNQLTTAPLIIIIRGAVNTGRERMVTLNKLLSLTSLC